MRRDLFGRLLEIIGDLRKAGGGMLTRAGRITHPQPKAEVRPLRRSMGCPSALVELSVRRSGGFGAGSALRPLPTPVWCAHSRRKAPSHFGSWCMIQRNRFFIAAGLIAILVISGPALGAIWKRSTEPQVKLGVGDRYGDSKTYVATFVVRDPDGKLYYANRQASGLDMAYVIFPDDFQTSGPPAGKYYWWAAVNGKYVTRDSFTMPPPSYFDGLE